MTELYDLDAAAAELEREPYQFTYKGETWTLRHLADVDWRLIEQADTGSIAAIREAIHAGFGCAHDKESEELPEEPTPTAGTDPDAELDPDAEAVEPKPRGRKHAEQAIRFDRLHQGLMLMNHLFDQWLKHAGLKPGESPASSDSSESTAGPSNRASRRATKSTPAKSSRATAPR